MQEPEDINRLPEAEAEPETIEEEPLPASAVFIDLPNVIWGASKLTHGGKFSLDWESLSRHIADLELDGTCCTHACAYTTAQTAYRHFEGVLMKELFRQLKSAGIDMTRRQEKRYRLVDHQRYLESRCRARAGFNSRGGFFTIRFKSGTYWFPATQGICGLILKSGNASAITSSLTLWSIVGRSPWAVLSFWEQAGSITLRMLPDFSTPALYSPVLRQNTGFFMRYTGGMSIQGFLLKQYANWKLKDLPPAQREQMTMMVGKDPALFKKIGEEIERRKKGGESETKAAVEVMRKYRSELSVLMGKQ